MDADDIAYSERLEKQLSFLKKINKDIIFSWAKLIDEKWEIVWEFNAPRQIVEKFEDNILSKSIFLHPSMFLKAEILKILKYDKKNLNSEDFEFLLRAIKKWYKFSIVEEFLISYRTPTWLSFDKRLKKLKGYSYFTFQALWKNKDYFWNRLDFWKKFFYSLFAWLSLRIMPDRFNIFLFKILDKVRK